MEKQERRQKVNLIAPASYWQATKEDIDNLTGGCGPGDAGDLIVPDKILGVSILEACKIHDWEYRYAKDESDKVNADFFFLLNMLEINYKKSKVKILRLLRDHIIFRYFLSVYYFGKAKGS